MLRKLRAILWPTTNTQSQPRPFIDVLKEYSDRYLSENALTQETVKRYDVYHKNIYLYLSAKGLQDLSLQNVKIKIMEDLRAWLMINLKTCRKRHASRHIELCKRVMEYAVMMEYIQYNPIDPIKPQRDKEKDVIALDTKELTKIQTFPFVKDYHRIVADLFTFQCYTGLSYADLYRYQITERNGRQWFEGTRSKSGENYLIFMFDAARKIHEKYRGKLPRISNQTYNSYLKDIADMLNIHKHLTTHVGRKTFATLLNDHGVTTKTIADSLGNTERVVERHYVLKTHKRIENEMRRLGLDQSGFGDQILMN